jgi:zinc/manganese transport system substrate-binding protein
MNSKVARNPGKRAVASAVAGGLAAVLVAARAAAGLTVAATITDLAEVARAVGGDRVAVIPLARGDQDPHDVPARPSLMRALVRADAVVSAGLDLEAGWLPLVVRGSRNPRIQPGAPGFLDASAAVEPIEVPAGPVSRAEGDIHPYGNPHWFTDPLALAAAARWLGNRFGELDPGGRDGYAARAADLARRLEAGHARWAERMRPFAGRRIVPFHRDLGYFLRRYGLEPDGYVEPRPGIPPTPRHLDGLVAAMRAGGVTVVAYQVYRDAALARKVAARAGGTAVLLPTEVGGAPDAGDLFAKFDAMTSRLAAALGPPPGKPAP